MANYWVKKLHLKKGALSRQLDIPVKDKIPTTLLQRIVRAKAGQSIKNPTRIGKRTIKVTPRLERRAILALNLRKMG